MCIFCLSVTTYIQTFIDIESWMHTADVLDGCRLGLPIFHVYGHNVSGQVQELNKNSCILQSCKKNTIMLHAIFM